MPRKDPWTNKKRRRKRRRVSRYLEDEDSADSFETRDSNALVPARAPGEPSVVPVLITVKREPLEEHAASPEISTRTPVPGYSRDEFMQDLNEILRLGRNSSSQNVDVEAECHSDASTIPEPMDVDEGSVEDIRDARSSLNGKSARDLPGSSSETVVPAPSPENKAQTLIPKLIIKQEPPDDFQNHCTEPITSADARESRQNKTLQGHTSDTVRDTPQNSTTDPTDHADQNWDPNIRIKTEPPDDYDYDGRSNVTGDGGVPKKSPKKRSAEIEEALLKLRKRTRIKSEPLSSVGATADDDGGEASSVVEQNGMDTSASRDPETDGEKIDFRLVKTSATTGNESGQSNVEGKANSHSDDSNRSIISALNLIKETTNNLLAKTKEVVPSLSNFQKCASVTGREDSIPSSFTPETAASNLSTSSSSAPRSETSSAERSDDAERQKFSTETLKYFNLNTKIDKDDVAEALLSISKYSVNRRFGLFFDDTAKRINERFQKPNNDQKLCPKLSKGDRSQGILYKKEATVPDSVPSSVKSEKVSTRDTSENFGFHSPTLPRARFHLAPHVSGKTVVNPQSSLQPVASSMAERAPSISGKTATSPQSSLYHSINSTVNRTPDLPTSGAFRFCPPKVPIVSSVPPQISGATTPDLINLAPSRSRPAAIPSNQLSLAGENVPEKTEISAEILAEIIQALKSSALLDGLNSPANTNVPSNVNITGCSSPIVNDSIIPSSTSLPESYSSIPPTVPVQNLSRHQVSFQTVKPNQTVPLPQLPSRAVSPDQNFSHQQLPSQTVTSVRNRDSVATDRLGSAVSPNVNVRPERSNSVHYPQISDSSVSRDPRINHYSFLPRRGGESTLNLYQNVGKDIINIYFSTLVLQWNAGWLQTQDSKGICAPICETYPNVQYSYDDAVHYYNTYVPLHLLSVWLRMSDCWKKQTGAQFTCTFDYQEDKCDYVRIMCSTELRDSDIWPKREDILLCSINKPNGKVEEVFLRVVGVMSRAQSEDRKKLKIECRAVVLLDLLAGQNVIIRILFNVRIAFLQNDAFHFPDPVSSHCVKSLVLKPAKHKQRIAVVKLQPNKHVKILRNEILSVLTRDPIQVTLVDTSYACDVVLLITQVAYALMTQNKSKVLICMKSEESFHKLARRLMEYNPVLGVRTKEILLPEDMKKFTLEQRLAKGETAHDISKVCDIFMTTFSAFHPNEANVMSKLRLTCIVDEAHMCTEAETILPLKLKVKKLVLMGKESMKPVVPTILQHYGYDITLFHRLLKAT